MLVSKLTERNWKVCGKMSRGCFPTWRGEALVILDIHITSLSVYFLIAFYVFFAQVIIITNSDDGWVHFSAERFVPNLLPVLSKYRIVSARTRYEHFYPGQPLCWKAAAFAHEVNETFAALEVKIKSRSRTETQDSDNTLNSSSDSLVSTDDSSNDSQSSIEGDTPSGTCFNSKHGKTLINSSPRREVISFGDSMEERTAVKIVSGQLSAVPKSVMFITTPTPLQLIGQLTMLTAHMKFVCENSSSLDLEISSDQAQKCADTYLEQDKSLGGQTGLLQIVSLE